MFRITFLTEDKNVPLVLRMVVGKAFDMECVPIEPETPLLPAPTNGVEHAKLPDRAFVPGEKKLRAPFTISNPKRRPFSDFQTLVKKGQELRGTEISELFVQLGWQRNSYSYGIGKLMEAKIIRRVGVGQYKVN